MRDYDKALALFGNYDMKYHDFDFDGMCLSININSGYTLHLFFDQYGKLTEDTRIN